MDAVEKWLVDQAHKHPEGAERDAILVVATHWHHEGFAVLREDLHDRVGVLVDRTIDRLLQR